MRWLNYTHLQAFWAVARAGGVTAAAEAQRLSPSTLSQHIKQLEAALGAPLLRRTGRGVELTPFGEQVQAHAERIFQTGHALMAMAEAGVAPATRTVVIGVAEQLPKDTVRRALAPALAAGAGLVQLVEGRPRALWRQLTDHELDLMLTDEPLPAADRREDARQVRLLDEPSMVWGSEALRLAHQRGYPRSLDGAPFVLPARGTAIRRRFDEWIHALGARPRVVAECEDRALALALARAGHGLTVAPLDGSAPKGLAVLGDAPAVRETTWGLALTRPVAHPAVAAVLGAA
ncbi:MAG: LysR family transcriptional regulator [Myxococcales bacterium]|nr:LysR family transcriptional regulator [Myxococcales bacterium]